MKFQTLKLSLLIAMALLLLAGVVSMISGASPSDPANTPNQQIDGSSGDSTEVTPTPPVNQTNTPVTPLVTLTLKPVVTTPTPTAKPTPTVTPTATPVPTPTPVPPPAVRDLGSGSFRSETGVPINLVCSWSAKTSGSGTAEVTVHAALECYSLYINASANALRFTINGNSASMNMPAISSDSTELVLTDLGSKSFTVNLADGESLTVPISVEWMFGGVYSDVQLDVVTASTSAALSR